MTGVSTVATRRCYWKLSSMSRGSTELAIVPPTGSLWEKRAAKEEWIVTQSSRDTKTGLRRAAAQTRPTATLCHRSPECLTHQRRLTRKQVQFLFDEVFRLSGKAHETLSSYGLNGITAAVSFLFIFCALTFHQHQIRCLQIA